jgi:hypothetical protein
MSRATYASLSTTPFDYVSMTRLKRSDWEDTLAATPPFEIPPELRELAEKNIEQARAAYGQFMDFLTQAIGASSKASSEFRVVQERAIQFARENADRSFSLGRELARAKDVQEVLTLHSQFMQTQMQSYALQTQELGQLLSEAMHAIQPRQQS